MIAFASGQGLPISTTYVAFASVVATAWGDGVYIDGNSEVKVGRIVWVVSGWFMSAFLAFIISFSVALVIYHGRLVGLSLCLIVFFLTRVMSQRMEKKHTNKYNKTLKKERKNMVINKGLW